MMDNYRVVNVKASVFFNLNCFFTPSVLTLDSAFRLTPPRKALGCISWSSRGALLGGC